MKQLVNLCAQKNSIDYNDYMASINKGYTLQPEQDDLLFAIGIHQIPDKV